MENEINNFEDLKKYKVDIKFYPMRVDDFLAAKRFKISPDFQRNYVWDDLRVSLLIESILLGLPIPPIFTYINLATGEESVIDGQQRLMALKKFKQRSFKLKGLPRLKFLNGLTYYELADNYKMIINMYMLNIFCLSNIVSKQVIFEVFRRFNTGGLKLNAQEIRNCIYGGKYNDFIKTLSKDKVFSKLMSKVNVKRLLQEELTVRFFTMYDNLDKYSGGMNELINKYYEEKAYLDNLTKLEFDKQVKDYKNTFIDCINACEIVFGQFAFRNIEVFDKPINGKNYGFGSFSKLVFDMQMLGFADIDLAGINRHAESIKEKYVKIVMTDEDMIPNTKNNNKLTAKRIRKWQECVRKIVSE